MTHRLKNLVFLVWTLFSELHAFCFSFVSFLSREQFSQRKTKKTKTKNVYKIKPQIIKKTYLDRGKKSNCFVKSLVH